MANGHSTTNNGHDPKGTMHTLISFLGKSQLDPRGGYRKAVYRFEDGLQEESSYFGLTLKNHLNPDRFVILGTKTSMWDVFFEGVDEKDEAIEKRLELIDRLKSETLTEANLRGLEAFVAKKLGMEAGSVLLRLIPFGRNEKEQLAVLKTMASWVEVGDTVSLDVTHGFRHLPMLSFLSALYLEQVKRAKIEGLYYGAAEMIQGGITPVLRLDGLLKIARWINAFHAFDHSGDYALLVPMLSDSGLSKEEGALLEEAAFFERIQRDGQAKSKILQGLSGIENLPALSPAGLFREALKERLAWAQEGRMFQRQAALAWRYLHRRDYLRAAIFAFEAFVTRLVQEGHGDPNSYEAHKIAKEDYERQNPRDARFESYRLLRNLRNALVHSTRENEGAVQKAVGSKEDLEATLKRVMAGLLATNPAPGGPHG